MTSTTSKSLGVKTAFTPSDRSFSTSPSGTMPPRTTGIFPAP